MRKSPSDSGGRVLLSVTAEKSLFLFSTLIFIFFIVPNIKAQSLPQHRLEFTKLASRWDEGIPLGNGMLGSLAWEKNGKLRLSLDRADLWDERKALDISKLNFKWVEQQVLKNDYKPVQKIGDWPYDNTPYPTKLPAAALQFDIKGLGTVISNQLEIATALHSVKFSSGVVFQSYIHATQQAGYFSFDHIPDENLIKDLLPKLDVHNYNSGAAAESDNSHAGEGLGKLGYSKGNIKEEEHTIRYHQPTYNGRFFEVLVKWKKIGKDKLTGSWTISDNRSAALSLPQQLITNSDEWKSHVKWWNDFWSKSSVKLPDELIEKQYYLELYKLGSVSRKGAPAITLQAVWTADNGSLPPWKGDFHNDLNTQLSYWPAYTGNHLQEAVSFTDWLWKIRPANLQYTKQYFGVDGLNVPGVVTLNGDPMGGWIQYSLSPTVSAWCAQYFYWQWKYSMDGRFLKQKAYPYVHDAAVYMENITRLKDGMRKLPLSSSPEYNDNSVNAWFKDWTNYDLSLARFLFSAASEIAKASGKEDEALHWKNILGELPDYNVNETGLTVAPGQSMESSHRHFSPYMAVYPLALLDVNQPKDKEIVDKSIQHIEKLGTRAWVGYSFTWMSTLYARAYQAEKAVKQLQIFASNFCSPNSFHLNGDQKGGQYSGFTYRPFTLEGNFAFAQGVHELLLQSRQGYIEVFPAIPKDWKNVSFTNLRAEGAVLVSGKIENEKLITVKLFSEKGGLVNVKLPKGNIQLAESKNAKADILNTDKTVINFKPGGWVSLQIYR
ncbi:glycoside hydrolase N-terminal domain-containing protein [Elizabethkingia sp. HX XZB]|uniref:glycosyl hydrolase family 95 catalytic domain-containing protein n=1 Tax=Elizabethkingia TaxID=308865 RepID=UPI002A23E2DC|nr:glycoside hydrolase N-terminal domain-containing protein [Elizabethkingia sp. HX XZB]MDX8569660.1 glycoside hydrolase N-terminal domain-containing protein [Elizabethkingia sp. HX XZB]